MNGMHHAHYWAYTTGSDDYTVTHQYELAPTSTLAQISLSDFYEFDDQSHADIAFLGCTYLDSSGVTRTDTFPVIDAFDAVHAFGRNGLASATFGIRVSNIAASYIVNFFFWDHVS